jgi:hypothetical protein
MPERPIAGVAFVTAPAPLAPAPPIVNYPTFLPAGGALVTAGPFSQDFGLAIGTSVTVIVTNLGPFPIFAMAGAADVVADTTSPCILPNSSFNLDGSTATTVALRTLAGSCTVSVVWGT